MEKIDMGLNIFLPVYKQTKLLKASYVSLNLVTIAMLWYNFAVIRWRNVMP